MRLVGHASSPLFQDVDIQHETSLKSLFRAAGAFAKAFGLKSADTLLDVLEPALNEAIGDALAAIPSIERVNLC